MPEGRYGASPAAGGGRDRGGGADRALFVRRAGGGAQDSRPRPASLTELFLVFSALALRGFGGVLPWAQRVLVDDRGWLSREEFVEMLAFGQMLPGPNVCNVALMVGDRWFGWRGALAALGGMLAAPCVVVLSLAVLHGQVADDPVVRRALIGMGAVAGGLILGTALRLATTQRGQTPWLVFGALAFTGVALLRIKLAWVVLALGPFAVLAAWLTNRRRGGGAAR
jgi:chromate transporter